ncbi:MAG: aspartate--tRNA ligase [Gemmatimonadetes bacterium]|nr:aspartate--tRNA ligase [Gemmatimonadota bacterium]
MHPEPTEKSTLATQWRDTLCGRVTAERAGQGIRVAGWVHRRRNLGGLYFIDLRDHGGLLQVSVSPDTCPPELVELVRDLNPEDVIQVEGAVAMRPREARNPAMATGEVEVAAAKIKRITESEPLPILVYQPPEEDLPSEELRLRHRILDLRRPEMQHNLRLRHRSAQAVRRSLADEGFVEIETPLLTRQTPEGARDYLVPSRVHKGRFFALPQSPQLYKQLLMCSGFDRYFQIVKCLRDEDLRADRQPEFTQIDIEMAFVGQEDVFRVAEKMFAAVWEEGAGEDLATPFTRITHADAMEFYGSDRPDLRIPWRIADFTDLLSGRGFGILDGAVSAGGRVRGVVAKDGASLSRKRIAHYDELAREHGAKGALWMKRNPDGWSGPPARIVDDELAARLEHETGIEPGDLVWLMAGPDHLILPALGALRLASARELGAVDKSESRWAWITEFPLFLPDEETGSPVPAQHPFTMPLDPDPERLRDDPLSVKAVAYDVVCNGMEFASGSIRCHLSETQRAILSTMGLNDEEIEARFGFLLEAFRYGAPPHGGFAAGFDRMIAVMAGAESIRDVIAFPKTAAARGLMERSPSLVSADELEELGIDTSKAEADPPPAG